MQKRSMYKECIKLRNEGSAGLPGGRLPAAARLGHKEAYPLSNHTDENNSARKRRERLIRHFMSAPSRNSVNSKEMGKMEINNNRVLVT